MQRVSRPLLAALLGLAALVAGPLAAQTATLRMASGPYYAGVPIEVQIALEGFAEEPRPEVAAGIPRNAAIETVAISPQLSRSMQIRNGRMTETRSVLWTAHLRLVVAAPGPFTLPAIDVRQGSLRARVEERSLTAQEIPVSNEVGIELVLPERPVYPGQRVPIRVRMSLAERLGESIAGYTIRSELFDRGEEFDFVDEAARRGEQTLEILARGEPVRLPATVERARDGGRPMLAVVAERTLVPLRAGTIELPPATLVLEEVTRWQATGFFGDRRPAEKRLHLARDLPRRLIVAELPAAGRPASFAGAVGHGFSLGLEADRTVVQVGDPITLTITLRGDGNLENAGLPPLAAAGLPAGFQAPETTPPGLFAESAKVFRVMVRVRDESVREVPPLEYAWFDPDAQAYRTVRTAPVALSVRRGETVGAEAVVGGPAPEEPGADGVPGAAANRPRFTLVGADLSIENDPARLVRRERDRFGGAPLRVTLYALSVLLVLGALGVRARDRVPAEVRERRSRLAAAAREVERAAAALGTEETPELLRALAGGLRAMQREVKRGGGAAVELEPFLAECEERIYAPGAARPAGELGARAVALARALVEAGR